MMYLTIIKNLKQVCALAFCLGVVWSSSAKAQSSKIEAATESQLLQITLPANAQRVLPENVPAEITQTLEKVIAAGNGKFRQGNCEVLVWGGADYKRADASRIINRLTGSLKTAGWQYAVEGEESGVTVFTALKESSRNAVVGLYGATDDGLIVAAMEILPNNGAATTAHQQVGTNDSVEQAQRPAATKVNSAGGGSIVGEWSDGYSSILSGYTPVYGPKTYTPGKSHVFKYVFHPDGTFEFTGLLQTTMFSCTSSIFQDKRGTYAISGNRITLKKTKNFFRRTDSCSASNNMERDYNLDPETYTLSVRRNDSGKDEVCLDSGNGDACYQRQD
jgi:hypothetical protein